MIFPFSHGIEPNRLAKATAGMDADQLDKFVHENWGEDEPEEDECDDGIYDDIYDDDEDYDDIYDEED